MANRKSLVDSARFRVARLGLGSPRTGGSLSFVAFRFCGILVGLAATVLAFAGQTKGAPDTFGMTPPQFWRTAFGKSPWIPLAGDADGDGHADLLMIGPDGDSRIEISRTSPIGKPFVSSVARNTMGNGLVAAACGAFLHGSKSADVLAVFEDGSVRVAWGMTPGADTYPHLSDVCKIAGESIPKAPCRSAVADFAGDGNPDVLILDREGKLLLIRAAIGQDGHTYFTPLRISNRLLGVRQFSAGVLATNQRGQCVWIDNAGDVWRALVEVTRDGRASLGSATRITSASPDDHIAVGRFRGRKSADLLVGQRLLTGGDPTATVLLTGIPPTSVTKDDEAWVVADLVGNGKDDLIRHCRLKQRFGGDDVYVHFAYDSTDPAKGYYCSADDGLLDLWKMGNMKPGGIDLAALGCKVGRRDVIVEIERFDNDPFDNLKANMDHVVRYFASLPISNPDGTTGIAVHMTYGRPWPIGKKDELWKHFDDTFPPKAHRGVVHSVFCCNGGPLVSRFNSDLSHSNLGWKEFLHEFGHQLDLYHDGFHPNLSGLPNDSGGALYPSLMSYFYSYSLDGDGDKVGYSDGSLASLQVDQRHLSERLPFPISKVHFLSDMPFGFKIKPSADGKSTLVDWNWNGIFGDEDVSADISNSQGIDPGPLWKVAKADTAPELVVHGDRPLLVYGRNSGVAARTWIGNNKDTEGPRWSDEGTDMNAGLAGDPTAAYLGDQTTWVAYPTAKGTVLRSVTVGAGGRPSFGEPNLVPATSRAQPTLAAIGGRLALLLWRNKTWKVGLRMITVEGSRLTVAGERTLDIVSDVPVGAVAGPIGSEGPSLWVGRIQSDGFDHGGLTEVVRFVLGSSERIAYRAWLGGTYARHRMTLLWRKEAGILPEGRVFMLSGGTGEQDAQQQFLAMNIPYPDVGNGWLYRRIQLPDFTSASAPGACFFQGDILAAFRHPGDDAVNVVFYCTGATPRPLGDFDDIGHIRDYGLSRSIREVPR